MNVCLGLWPLLLCLHGIHGMQALRKSLIDQKRIINAVPEAPVFYPTVEQFKDVLGYIAGIKKAGEAAGIVKIVPPPGMCICTISQVMLLYAEMICQGTQMTRKSAYTGVMCAFCRLEAII